MEKSQPAEDPVAPDERSRSALQNRVRRRNRMITSCLECRRRKLKCDKLHPCTNCSKFSRDCLFLAPALDSVSQQRLNEIKEKMGSLEKVLEQDVARQEGRASATSDGKARRRTSADLPGGEESSSDNEAAVPEDEKGLEPTPLAVIDGAYEGDTNDDVLDLGIRVGKMRLNERLGGFFRPKINEELSDYLDDPAADRRTPDEKLTAIPPLPDHGHDFLAPGPSFIAPGNGFLFGDVGNKRSLINFLPAKGAADVLVRNYHENVHFIARVVHWPSFQLHYDNFWTAILAGLEPPAWQQSVVLSILFAAVASMPEEEVTAIFARPKSTILGNFQTGTEVALSKAQFLRATKLETLQALVIYLIPMCRDQLSRAHSVLVGMAVRLAECMGLHRDPQDVYGLPPVDCHVRRIVWFQLCLLDFRTCEAQGPRPGIKREDYDTRFPLNINDADLLLATPQESTRWTDMTVSRIRFECTEMQRIIWYDRIRIEKKRVSLTHVLGKVESFRRAMEAKYTPILDPDVPIQKYAQLLMTLLIQRLYVMVLHRYLNNSRNRIPERLQSLTVQSAVQACENAIAMEQIPELKKWTWYSGAHQQWHMAFLLLSVIYQNPTLGETDSIWNILDFVFEPDPSLSRTIKARTIIAAIRDRTTVYRDLRKTRIPISMKVGLGARRVPLDNEDKNSAAAPLPGTGSPSTTEISSQRKATAPETTPASLDQSWSFDTPNTLYQTIYKASAGSGSSSAVGAGTAAGAGERSNIARFATQAYSQPQAQTAQSYAHQAAPWIEANQSPPGHQIDFNSPSDSGTNESWPPLITPDQQGWSTVLGSGHMSAQPAPAVQVLPPVASSGSLSGSASPFGVGSGYPSDQVNIPQFPPNIPRADSVMLDIDWAEWDQLFPQDGHPGFLGPAAGSFGISGQRL